MVDYGGTDGKSKKRGMKIDEEGFSMHGGGKVGPRGFMVTSRYRFGDETNWLP